MYKICFQLIMGLILAAPILAHDDHAVTTETILKKHKSSWQDYSDSQAVQLFDKYEVKFDYRYKNEEFLKIIDSFSDEKRKHVDTWGDALSRIYDRGESRFLEMLSLIDSYSDEKVALIDLWMKESDVLGKSRNSSQDHYIIETLRVLSQKTVPQITNILVLFWATKKVSGFEYFDVGHITGLLKNIISLTDDKLKCLKDSGILSDIKDRIIIDFILNKVSQLPTAQLLTLLAKVKEINTAIDLSRLRRLGILLDYLAVFSGWPINLDSLIRIIEETPNDLDAAKIIVELSRNQGQLVQDLVAVSLGYKRPFSYVGNLFSDIECIVDFSVTQLDALEKSLIISDCATSEQLKMVLDFSKGYGNPDALFLALSWLKKHRVISRFPYIGDLNLVLECLNKFDISLFGNPQSDLPQSCDFMQLYAVELSADNANPRYQAVLEKFIEIDGTRDDALAWIIELCGDDTPKAQYFLQLALGYDNAANPDSFLAVHQEMLEKRRDDVTHNQKTLQSEVALNTSVTRASAETKPIHMPVNVWDRLVDRLKTIPISDKKQFASLLGETSLDNLLQLKTDPSILALLDPRDSLVIVGPVSTHSKKLRELLHNSDINSDLGQFVQLLVNMQTCPTGKLNGIIHSYILMNQGRVLDESIIKEQRFKTEIVDFFVEELRRLREITLSNVLTNGLNLPSVDPHDLYYLRGILGSELGLNQEDEVQKIDINANNVNQALRVQTKQQLLDLFYSYYKVEDVIARIHTLLNSGSIQISGSKNLTMTIINEYLQGDAYDVDGDKYAAGFILLNQDMQPIGFTPKAAQKLLALMGILVPFDRAVEA